MTIRQNKLKLFDTGKSVTDLAKELCLKFPGPTEASMHTMISNMIYQRSYYPRYALYLNTQYGFGFEPLQYRGSKELLRQAA